LGPEVDEPVGGHPVVLSQESRQSQLGERREVLGDALIVNGQPLTGGTTFNVAAIVFVPLPMHGALAAGTGQGVQKTLELLGRSLRPP
jgi:hypothetical protein